MEGQLLGHIYDRRRDGWREDETNTRISVKLGNELKHLHLAHHGECGIWFPEKNRHCWRPLR